MESSGSAYDPYRPPANTTNQPSAKPKHVDRAKKKMSRFMKKIKEKNKPLDEIKTLFKVGFHSFVVEMDEDGNGETSECVVCLDAKPSHIFIQCCHLCVCGDCGSSLEQCPLCRAPSECKKVYTT